MAEESKTNYIESLKDDIKKNERIQNELKEEVRKLKEKLKDHDESCQTKINDLEEKIKTLKEENNTLQENIKELERKTGHLEESKKVLEKQMKEIDDNAKKEAYEAKTEIGELKTELGNLDEKLKKFELSEDELIIRQLCSSVQENLSRIVLQENFDKFQNKKTQYMQKYISSQIEDKKEQNEARLRWKKLKKEIKWDEYLLIQLKPVKMRGNDTSHPSLTEEIIDAAKMNLKEKGKLGKHMVKAVDQLKAILKQTNRELLQGTSSNGQEQGGQRVVSTTRQNHEDVRLPNGTYASKAAGGRGDDFGPRIANGRQSISRNMVVVDGESSYRTISNGQEQGGPNSVSTTRQNHEDVRTPNGTYASKAAGGRGDDFGLGERVAFTVVEGHPCFLDIHESFYRTTSNGQEQGGPRMLSTARQNYSDTCPIGTYASKAAGGREDDFGPRTASGRQSFSRNMVVVDGESSHRTISNGQEQGGPRSVSTTRQNHENRRLPNGTYASKAAGGRGGDFNPKKI